MGNSPALPKVSVAMAVYNEERYIEQSIRSIMAQDFQDFELIICDNASTDRTSAIASAYAARESRITYIRHPRNLGSGKNFSSAIQAARGEYIALAGGHDLWDANYLSSLANTLDNRPNAVTAYAPNVWIGQDGEPLGMHAGFTDTSGYSETTRFTLAVWSTNHYCIAGMHRAAALRQTSYDLPQLEAETLVVGELALLGECVVVPHTSWQCRLVRDDSGFDDHINRYYQSLFEERRYPLLPNWRIPVALVRFALRCGRPWPIRLTLLSTAVCTFGLFRHELVWDIKQFPRRWRVWWQAHRGSPSRLPDYAVVRQPAKTPS